VKKEKLELSVRQKAGYYAKILEKNLEVGDTVLFENNKHEIISIYSEHSPYCGYLLLSGIGLPVPPTGVEPLFQKQTNLVSNTF
jgi:hypothetical protein